MLNRKGLCTTLEDSYQFNLEDALLARWFRVNRHNLQPFQLHNCPPLLLSSRRCAGKRHHCKVHRGIMWNAPDRGNQALIEEELAVALLHRRHDVS